jgi:hypothetical protein
MSPLSLTRIHTLYVRQLQENAFSGSIPSALGNLTNMVILYVLWCIVVFGTACGLVVALTSVG